MRVLFPRVHEATRRLLRRVGYGVRNAEQGCCGSLHLHAGYVDAARTRAERLVRSLPEDLPVITNSAGCGSTMKRYEDLLGREGSVFARRVRDVSEFLLEAGLSEYLLSSPGVAATATYHDACHLAHGQGVRSAPRELLKAVPGLALVDLPESDTCCGSAGIYNLTQPRMAKRLLDRKWRHVESTGASIVVMGNPGCHAWLAQAAEEHGSAVTVMHTAELLESSFSPGNSQRCGAPVILPWRRCPQVRADRSVPGGDISRTSR
jgi:glycolate oxidase iron-sulfur subunit